MSLFVRLAALDKRSGLLAVLSHSPCQVRIYAPSSDRCLRSCLVCEGSPVSIYKCFPQRPRKRLPKMTTQSQVAQTTDPLDLQNQAEAKLRLSEGLLQAFFENSPNLVFVKDRQGRYLYANKQFFKVFHISGEIQGKTDGDLFSAAQAAAFQAVDRQVLQTGQLTKLDDVVLSEDGFHTRIVQKFPLSNTEGEIYAIGGVITDITDRKREEAALRHSEENYRLVVETAPDAVISIDESSAILFANPATARIFGYDPTELIGKKLTVL